MALFDYIFIHFAALATMRQKYIVGTIALHHWDKCEARCKIGNMPYFTFQIQSNMAIKTKHPLQQWYFKER